MKILAILAMLTSCLNWTHAVTLDDAIACEILSVGAKNAHFLKNQDVNTIEDLRILGESGKLLHPTLVDANEAAIFRDRLNQILTTPEAFDVVGIKREKLDAFLADLESTNRQSDAFGRMFGKSLIVVSGSSFVYLIAELFGSSEVHSGINFLASISLGIIVSSAYSLLKKLWGSGRTVTSGPSDILDSSVMVHDIPFGLWTWLENQNGTHPTTISQPSFENENVITLRVTESEGYAPSANDFVYIAVRKKLR